MITNIFLSIEFYKVLKDLRTIPTINEGGCGIAALSMYRWLKQKNLLNGDEHFKFLYLYDDYDMFFKNQYETVIDALQNSNSEIITPDHVVFYYSDNHYDSNGTKDHIIEADEMYNINLTQSVDEKQLVETINNVSDWSPKFNRNLYVPYIEEKLSITLSDIVLCDAFDKNVWEPEYLVQENY